jgi:hypothetical protein
VETAELKPSEVVIPLTGMLQERVRLMSLKEFWRAQKKDYQGGLQY